MLDKVKSNYFNFMRWVSAFLVLIGHIPMALLGFDNSIEFNKNFIYFSKFAHPAVIFFFLLSGYLIAFTVAKRDEGNRYTLKEYFFDRTSRIYSVLIYSLLLTILCDVTGSIYFDSYTNAAVIPQDNYILRFLINLFSFQGIWNNRIQFGSNPALWSIGYEYCFYLLFGIIYFKIVQKGKLNIKYFLVIFIIALLRGFPLMYYFLIWLFGVFAFQMSTKIKIKCHPIATLIILSFLLISAHHIYINEIISSNDYLKDAIFGLVICLCLIFNYTNYNLPDWFISVNKFFSGFSYSLYAYHLPILYLISATLIEMNIHNRLNINIIIYSMIIIVYIASYSLYRFTEERRSYIRIGLVKLYLNAEKYINRVIIEQNSIRMNKH